MTLMNTKVTLAFRHLDQYKLKTILYNTWALYGKKIQQNFHSRKKFILESCKHKHD